MPIPKENEKTLNEFELDSQNIKTDLRKQLESGNEAAGRRARRAMAEMKKTLKTLRSQSLEKTRSKKGE